MKRLYLFLFLTTCTLQAQRIQPSITARVDTSNVEIKKVYELYTHYLNSAIDSVYANPYFDTHNWKPSYTTADRSIFALINLPNRSSFFATYPPKILQIDAVAANRYQIKTLFAAENLPEQYQQFSPHAITKLYAVKQADNTWLLENVLDYDTRLWQQEQVGFINYIVSPQVQFNKNEAKEAIQFCKTIAKRFQLKTIPNFTYYLCANSDELDGLLNFEYILGYHTGVTDVFRKELFTAYQKANYEHELVHMLFPVEGTRAPILNEGFATWLGGPNQFETYEEALVKLSKQFQNHPPQSIDAILNFSYKNKGTNTVLYVTGATICEAIYQMHGDAGVLQLLQSTPDNYQYNIEQLTGKSFEEFSQSIINYITNYAK